MKRTTGLVYTVALLFCGLTGTMMWAQSEQPSLADVAKQKSAAKAKRVVTNDEIPPSPEANNPPAASSASGSSAPSGAKPGANSDARKDGDKSAMPAAKLTKLQQLTAERDNLERIIKHMREKIEASNDQSRIAGLSEVLQHAKDALAANQAEIDKLKASGATGSQPDATQPAASQPANAPPAPPK